MLQPPSPGSFVWFSLICSRGGEGSTAAAVTLDTVADESRKMADGVARSPSRLCSRDGKICCYGDALSTTFLLACFSALLPTFRFSFFLSFFFSLHPGMFIFFVSLRLCRSHLLLSTSTMYVFYSTCSSCLCHLYPTSSRNSFVFLFVLIITFSIFFVALISRVAFFFLLYLLLSYPVR